MVKDFISDSVLYSIANILSKGVFIFILPILTHYLTTYEFGIIETFVIFGAMMNIIAQLEIYQGVARFYIESESKEEKIAIFSTAFNFIICMYVGLVIVLVGFGKVFSDFLVGEGYLDLYYVAVASTVITGIFNFLLSQLKWNFKVLQFAYISFLYTFVSYVLGIVLIVKFGFGLEGYFLGTLVGGVLCAFLCFLQTKDYYQFVFDKKWFNALILFSAPLIMAALALKLNLYMDRIAIKKILGGDALGIYGVGYRYASIVGLVMLGVSSSLVPLIYKNYKDEKTKHFLSKVSNVFVSFILCTTLFFVLFAKEIIYYLAADGFYSAFTVMPIVAASVLFSRMIIFTPGIRIAKKTQVIFVINVSTVIINAALNFLLVPKLGIQGAAVATFISSLIIILSYLYYNQKYYPVPYNFTMLSTIVILIIAMLVSFLIDALPLEQAELFSGVFFIKLFAVAALFLFFINQQIGINKVLFFAKNFISQKLK